MGFLSRLFGKGDAKGASGTSSRNAPELISVAAVSQEYAWLEANPCECGGCWSLMQQSLLDRPGLPEQFKVDQMEMTCDNCGKESVFLFQVDTHSPQYVAEQQAMMKELFGDDAAELFDGGDDSSKPS